MTLQEIFDKVSNHLLTQRKKAIDKKTKLCKYKINKLKCAAGCLIPDKDYSKEIEHKSISDIEYFNDAGYSPSELNLINKLQVIHDVFPVKNWKSKLKLLANNSNLLFRE
jgi:hypothetical protein